MPRKTAKVINRAGTESDYIRGPASKPLSLYPLKFEEVIRDVLTMKPPPKKKRQRPGKGENR